MRRFVYQKLDSTFSCGLISSMPWDGKELRGGKQVVSSVETGGKQVVSSVETGSFCSVLNKLTLLKFEIHMEELKKKYTPYTESERMSYIREYLSTSETKYQFAKRTGICRRLLILWLEKYHINDKVMNTEQPSLSKASDESLNELEKELAALRAENRKLQRALQEESLRHEACEELINLAESTYHIKVRKNSDAK